MQNQTFGQYRIIKKIGEGGMGEVFLARDTILNRQVALKFLKPALQSDEKAKRRLIREAKAVAGLSQPFICSIYGVGEVEGSTYLAMEYIDGDSLHQQLVRGPLPIRKALRIAIEVAEALDTAHRKGIVHRDLKPSNIMITPDGHAKVLDFGLAKTAATSSNLEEHIDSLSLTLTDQEMIVGTISYMSPEQVKAESIDTRSDIFSFGLLLYEMLTGKHPFRSGSPLETAAAIISSTPPPLSEEIEEAKPGLQELIFTLLSKSAGNRPDTLELIRAELERFIEESSTTVGISYSGRGGGAIPIFTQCCWDSDARRDSPFT